MVPEGWDILTLGDLLKSSNQGINTTTEKVEYADSGVPAIRSNNIDIGKFDLRDEKFVSEEEYSRFSNKFKPVIGDILYCNIGSNLGSACVNDMDIPFLITWNVFRAVPNKNLLNPHFGALQLNFKRKDLRRFATESTMPFISSKVLLKYKFLVPPLSEQKKIAQILSTWDKAITTTEQLLTNSQQQKKALMQQLLTGKQRLLDQNGERFEGDFKRRHFSDLLAIDKKSLGSKTDPDFEFEYISLSDVDAGCISSILGRYSFKTAPSRARRIVASGDILMATVRPNLQGFAKVREQHEHCIASTGFAVLTPKKGTCGDYVYHYLFGSHITGQINALVVGTNYPAINSSDVSGLCIYCPHYEEQIEIAKVLNSSDELINALQQKLEALKQEKKALMQQLLTGKRRVKVDDKEAA